MTFSSDIAVVYLARYAEGDAPMAKFAASYRRHPAGIAHDLVVIKKGFPDEGSTVSAAMAGLDMFPIAVSDEGFDISAYAAAATQLPHRYIAFLNTFSDIVADDWLLKLVTPLADPLIGATGATASYESPRTSMRRLKMGLFLAQRRFSPSLGRLRGVFQAVRRMLPKHLSRFLVNYLIGRLAASPDRSDSAAVADAEFEAFWVKETKADGTFDEINAIPDFPNPHLRTNGFAIERQLFLDLVPQTISTKGASYFFESGPDSLTAQLRRRQRAVVVVGRDGIVYDIEAWPRSGTFRLGDQSNLLIHDNQTRAFAAMTQSGKTAFTALAWGDDIASLF